VTVFVQSGAAADTVRGASSANRASNKRIN
jgi:hypothetical protein